jgi:hypothetical protein
MRASRLLLGLLLLVPSAAASPELEPAFTKDPPAVLDLVQKAAIEISGQRIYDCVNEITTSGATGYRLMGSPNRDLFVQKYGKVFSSISPRILDQVVTFKQGNLPAGVGPASPTGKNIIGVLPGKDRTRWVVMGGHYDTQAPTMGAIDNTSGICVVKELARAYIAVGLQPEATIVFAWWDGEEWGLYGSNSFVKDHNETSKLLGVDDSKVKILVGESFDIVGVNYPAYNTFVGYGDPTKIVDEYADLNLRHAPTDEAHCRPLYTRICGRDDKERVFLNNSRYAGVVKEVSFKLLGFPTRFVNAHDDQYGRSDQVPFIAAGIPGMRIQGSHDCVPPDRAQCQFPNYHQPTDTLAAAEVQAGGKERLVSGFQSAAQTGGLTAFYVGLIGDYGHYSNRTDDATPPMSNSASPPGKKSTPALWEPLVLLAVAAAVLLRRRP